MSLLSSVLSAEDKLPRKEKTTTQRQTDNSIRIWELLFQNLATWHERKIERPKFTTDFSILFTNGHSDRLLSNPSSAGPVTIVLEVLLLIFKITVDNTSSISAQPTTFSSATQPFNTELSA